MSEPLTTLERVLLQIPTATTDDYPLLTTLILVASGVIEAKCNRTFAQATYDELHGPIGPTCSIWVNNPPVSDVIAVRNTLFPAIYVTCADPTSQVQFATVDVTPTAVVLKKMFDNVLVTNQTFSFASYPTFAELGSAIDGLGNSWSTTVPNQFIKWQTSDLTTNQSGRSARNVSLPLCVYWWYLWDHKVNKDIGEIYAPGGPVPGYQNYRVAYIGGYATVPEEIQQACCELVQLMFNFRGLNPLMQSETLDRYSYTRMVPNWWDLLSLGSKLAIQQYTIHRFSVSGVPAQG
jgi:hypothetical protein